MTELTIVEVMKLIDEIDEEKVLKDLEGERSKFVKVGFTMAKIMMRQKLMERLK